MRSFFLGEHRNQRKKHYIVIFLLDNYECIYEKNTLEHTFRKHKAPPLTNTVCLKRFNIIFKKSVVPFLKALNGACNSYSLSIVLISLFEFHFLKLKRTRLFMLQNIDHRITSFYFGKIILQIKVHLFEFVLKQSQKLN